MNIPQYDLICIGELLIDFVGVEQVDRSSTSEVYEANPGGAPANVAAAVSRYGFNTAFIGAVGEDHFGSVLTNTLQDQGIDTSGIVQTKDAFTTLAFVSLDEEANRSFSFSRKPGADTCLELNEHHREQLKNTKLLHFGSLSLTHDPARTATREAVEIVKAAGGLVSYDPNLRLALWSSREHMLEQIYWGFKHADILKISDEDIQEIDSRPVKEFVDALLRDTPIRLVLLSTGPEGSEAYWHDHTGTLQSVSASTDPSIRAIDTTGAGDIFTGAFHSNLLSQLYAIDKVNICEAFKTWSLSCNSIEAMLLFSNQIAGLSTTVRGGIPSIPSLDQWTDKYT